MLAVYKQIAHAAGAGAVLVVGGSGTGKELVARAIHRHGRRAARPFVPINCGALTETLLESELFGHTRGAFTGAVNDARGLFEQAQGGTIFLDEISETSPARQVKLLRVRRKAKCGRSAPADGKGGCPRGGRHQRGSRGSRRSGPVPAGPHYRLSVLVIRVPALKGRRDDIPLLVERFLQNACGRAGRTMSIAPGALERLASYHWPGNVRELENTIERLVLTSPGHVITADDVRLGSATSETRTPGGGFESRMFEGLPTLDELERRYLLHVLDAVSGNRTRAAEALGIDRRTLYRMAERFGLSLPEPGGSSDADKVSEPRP